MNERLRSWLPLSILMVGGLGAWGLAQGRTQAEVPAVEVPVPEVSVVQVRPHDERVVVRTHGTVEPRTEIDLMAEIEGRVASVSPSLAVGAFFGAGDWLVVLDREDALLALERTEAAVARARSELRLAEARFARQRSLARSQIASGAMLEESEHAEKIARAQLRETIATRAQAQRDLDRTRIAAPFAGRVRSKQIDGGQFVSRGTVLARIHAVDFAEVRLPIPTAELKHLDVPLAGGVRDAPGPGPRVILRANFAGTRGHWEARIVRVEGEISPRSRMLNLVARVEDPYGLETAEPQLPLTVGLFVEAEISGRTLEGVFALPRSALRPESEVLVVDAEGQLRARKVEVLRLEDERVLVGDGLASGERVLVSALGALAGTRVRIRGAEELDDASAPLPLVGLGP